MPNCAACGKAYLTENGHRCATMKRPKRKVVRETWTTRLARDPFKPYALWPENNRVMIPTYKFRHGDTVRVTITLVKREKK